eukprot:scaffold11431_cov118-Isochrysis_galbana.AAC.14
MGRTACLLIARLELEAGHGRGLSPGVERFRRLAHLERPPSRHWAEDCAVSLCASCGLCRCSV